MITLEQDLTYRAAQDTLVKHEYRITGAPDGGTMVVDLEEIKSKITNDFYAPLYGQFLLPG